MRVLLFYSDELEFLGYNLQVARVTNIASLLGNKAKIY